MAQLLELKDANPMSVPFVKPFLGKSNTGKDRESDILLWRSAAVLLQPLSGCARPDVSMATHQESKFSTNSKVHHDTAVKIISKHLLRTNDEGLMHILNEDKGFE